MTKGNTVLILALTAAVGIIAGLGLSSVLEARGSQVDWSAVGSITTTAALLTAALALIHDRRSVKQQNTVQLSLSLLTEWRSTEFNDCRRTLCEELPTHEGSAVNDLPKELRTAFIRTSFFCDVLGLLVANDLVDERLLSGYLGGACQRLGRMMMPFIREERKRRADQGDSDVYQDFFEDFLCRLEARPQKRVIQELKKLPHGSATTA